MPQGSAGLANADNQSVRTIPVSRARAASHAPNVHRLQSLVGGIEVDVDAPLSDADE